ncbi:MAG: MATE family efflux transporter [Lachnospiraceae bacterium]|jgi:putative MATE family efflux protein|nr:MATE family efflux transporter [Lachnospiraceae bacterium]MCH4028782.1 MATE family efflux transporter [Lachnospiraceae bacterium]MCH4066632.1 MATE family efflux transporter [Lachnospiraceae bacterium]MCH4112662.1 MATE family efflux transporter [Lachnospiraceae bacterium]MCI1551097.1 MATE family efflux transporter [Lachnospiraceae bacterium]
MNEKADAGRTGFDGGEGSASVSSASVTAISEKLENTGRGKAGRRVFTRSERRGMFREAVSMAWPAVLESFFTSLAGMIDTMMVSSMGSYAVAAVGLTSQPKFIGLTPFFAVNVAVSALVARRKGENNKKSANETLMTALCLSLIICAAVSVIFVVWAEPILRIAGSNEDTHEPASAYFRIIMGGTFFSMIQMLFNSAQRGSGNTRISMTTNVASSITNICFNYCLIGGHFGFPALGCTGAAIATVLGTVVGAAMSFGSLFMKKSYVSLPYIRKEKIRPKHYDFKIIGKLSSNMLAENLLMRIGFLVTAFVAARIGTDAFAAHNVGMNLLGLSFSFADGMQAAGVALSGQALGANKKEEAKLYGKICQKIGAFISACIAVILLFGGRGIFRMFFDDPAILDMGVMISRYICVITFFQISQVIYGACLRAAGDVRYTLIASTISVTLIRSAMTILLVYMLNLGLAGIWLGVLSDQLSRYIFMSIRFRQGKWVNNKF